MKAILCIALLTLAATHLPAADFTWTGTSNAQWNNGVNWGLPFSTPVPGASDRMIFPAAGANKAMNNNIAAGQFWRMEFTGNGYSAGGNAFTLVASGANPSRIDLLYTSGGTTTITAPFTISGSSNTVFEVSHASANLALNSAITINNPLTLNPGPGTITVNDKMSGVMAVTIGAGTGGVRYEVSQLYAGATTVNGNLTVNGTMPGAVTVATTGTLRGTGTIESTTTVNGDLAPGDFVPGRMTFDGNLAFGAGTDDDVFFKLNGTVAGTSYDQVRCNAGLTTNGARIHLQQGIGFPLGTVFKLFDKTSGGAITNATPFRAPDGSNISEGTIVVYNLNAFQFSYVGTGNDFTATVVPVPTGSGSGTWDGEGTPPLHMGNAVNWSPNTLPLPEQTLTFGIGPVGSKRFPVNDLGSPNFFALAFNGGSYTLSSSLPANSIILSGGITSSQVLSAGPNTISSQLVIGLPQSITQSGSGTLVLADDVNLNGKLLTVDASGGIIEVSGRFTGAGIGSSVEKKGGAQLLYTGSASTHGGATTVTNGNFHVNMSSAGNAIPGALNIGGGPFAASFTSTSAERIADTSTVTVDPNGTFSPQDETIANLVLAGGTVSIGSNNLTVLGNPSVTANSVINGSGEIRLGNVTTRTITTNAGITLTVNAPLAGTGSTTTLGVGGPGTLRINNTSLIFAQINIGPGTLDLISANTGGTINFVSLTTGTVQGTGTVGFVTWNAISAQATLNPGSNLNTQSITNSAGSNARFLFDVTALQSSTSTLSVSGFVALGNATLALSQPSGSTIVGTTLVLIDNDSTDAVTGTFSGLPQGSTVRTQGSQFVLSYVGGTGNDVTITSVTPTASGSTRVWNGAAGDGQWKTPGNWTGGVAPQPGDSLEFPSAVHTTSNNNYSSNFIFDSITFTGTPPGPGAITTTGNAFQLLGAITSQVTDDPTRLVAISNGVTFLATNATVTNTGDRAFRFDGPVAAPGIELRLRGNNGSPRRKIQFHSTAPISGAARLVVQQNADVDLGTALHAHSGGNFADNGILRGRLSNSLSGPLEVGGSGFSAFVDLDGVASPSGEDIYIGENGTLSILGDLLICGNLTVADGGTLSAPASPVAASGTISVSGSALTGMVTAFNLDLPLASGSLNTLGESVKIDNVVAATGTITCGSFSSDTLNLVNGELNCSGSVAVNQQLTIDGSDDLSATELDAPRIIVNGGSLAVTGEIRVTQVTPGGSLVFTGGAIATPGKLGFSAPGTHEIQVTSSSPLIVGQLGGSTSQNLTLQKTGNGEIRVLTQILNNNTTLSAGVFTQNGTAAAFPGGVFNLSGGTLRGNGSVSQLNIIAGGAKTISPGSSTGELTVTHSGPLGPASAVLAIEVNGPTPVTGYDRINAVDPATGTLSLTVTLNPLFTPSVGHEFVLLTNPGATPLPQVFIGIPEGHTATWAPGVTVEYSYKGGDGNDFSAFVLTAPVPSPPAITNISITPAGPATPATFSGFVTGPANTSVEMEASFDLGQNDPWSVIHSFSLDANGEATLTDIPHPGSEGAATDFFRFRFTW